MAITQLLVGALATAALLSPVVHSALDVKSFGGTDDRKATRIFYYTQDDGSFKTHGQFSFDYGTPTWKKEYNNKESFDKQTRGKTWRFGAGPWTQLDTNVELMIGETKVAPGAYYCVLSRNDADQISLVLLDPDEIRKEKMDAFQAASVKGGISIPLKWTQDNDTVEKMSIKLNAPKDPKDVGFEILWGPHKLTTKIKAVVE